MEESVQYDADMHHKWCNVHKMGMTHGHFLPETFNMKGLRFDTFHGRVGTVKVMMGYVRSLLDNDYDILEKFKEFLKTLKHWDDYVIDQFVSGDTSNMLKGKHAKILLKEADAVINKLRQLVDEVDIAEFCICLKAFQKCPQYYLLCL